MDIGVSNVEFYNLKLYYQLTWQVYLLLSYYIFG